VSTLRLTGWVLTIPGSLFLVLGGLLALQGNPLVALLLPLVGLASLFLLPGLAYIYARQARDTTWQTSFLLFVLIGFFTLGIGFIVPIALIGRGLKQERSQEVALLLFTAGCGLVVGLGAMVVFIARSYLPIPLPLIGVFSLAYAGGWLLIRNWIRVDQQGG
jgi:hypothetical protein